MYATNLPARSIHDLTTTLLMVLVFIALPRLLGLKSPFRPVIVTSERSSLARTVVKRTLQSL